MLKESGRISRDTKGLPPPQLYREQLPSPNCYKAQPESDPTPGQGCPAV